MKKAFFRRLGAWTVLALMFSGEAFGLTPAAKPGLSQNEVIRGLKEALVLGVNTAAGRASRIDGFYKNPLIFIPFPPEAIQMKQMLEKIGLKSQVNKLVLTLNRAAEESAKKAAPIFLQAVKELTIEDGFQILRGPNDAATAYLRRKTSAPLTKAFRPVVRSAMDKVEVTKYWNPLVTQYNRIPFMQKVNPNLEDYVTDRAVSGLFKLIAEEERKIRKDP
ncbi:MAG TPA: DUF4197 domain-containing protein, partial [bacterium]|nr:DUF4197 domain-containing protein [bacterium]